MPKGEKKLKPKGIKTESEFENIGSLDQSTLLLTAIRPPNKFLHPQSCIKEAEISLIMLSIRYYLVCFDLSIYRIIIMYTV